MRHTCKIAKDGRCEHYNCRRVMTTLATIERASQNGGLDYTIPMYRARELYNQGKLSLVDNGHYSTQQFDPLRITIGDKIE